MSAGHGHDGDIDTRGLSAVTINRLLANSEIKSRLYAPHIINREYDLPYLGGYSVDGSTIYLDRHFPLSLVCEYDGHKTEFDPTSHICDHEKIEKAIIDTLGWGYKHAHEAANGYERRGVLKAGLMWDPYNRCLDPYIKADEHEKLKKVPPDLDMTPYYAEPVDKRLLAHMEAVMGSKKKSKQEVNYEPQASMPSKKCSKCEHFQSPNHCLLVRGMISPAGWCELYEVRSA